MRGLQPWPTAFTHWVRPGEGKPPIRLQITRVRSLPDEVHHAQPGDLLSPPDDLSCLRVATGAGILEILSVQPAGKAVMDSAAFLRGRRYVLGDKLERVG